LHAEGERKAGAQPKWPQSMSLKSAGGDLQVVRPGRSRCRCRGIGQRVTASQEARGYNAAAMRIFCSPLLRFKLRLIQNPGCNCCNLFNFLNQSMHEPSRCRLLVVIRVSVAELLLQFHLTPSGGASSCEPAQLRPFNDLPLQRFNVAKPSEGRRQTHPTPKAFGARPLPIW
jgi:hypothetical protein